MRKVFKAAIEVKAKTQIMDSETADEDGDNAKVLHHKYQINEIVMEKFINAIREKIEAIDEDDEVRDAIFEELGVDFSDYDLGDIAEVKISF